MEALVPALIAALVAGVGDRPAMIAARIGDRYRGRWAIVTLVVAHAAAAAIAVTGAWVVAPLLTANARALLLALALIAGGVGALLRAGPPRVERCTGGRATTFVAMIGAALGDRTTFITFALAVRGPEPTLAGIGATIGAVVLGVAAVTLGERGWRALPLPALSILGGALLVGVGIVTGLAGLRLI